MPEGVSSTFEKQHEECLPLDNNEGQHFHAALPAFSRNAKQSGFFLWHVDGFVITYVPILYCQEKSRLNGITDSEHRYDMDWIYRKFGPFVGFMNR